MALEVEAGGVLEGAGIPVLFTGVGKVNAAYALTRKLTEYRCAGIPLPRVVNFGTAGSNRFKTGAVVACRSFVQGDMDVTGLGFPLGTTPFDHVPAEIQFPVTVPNLPQATCSTRDAFETGSTAMARDVFDMEAYALAKVCWLEKAEFTCVKYITDGADHAAASDWQANLPRAAAAFLEVYRQLFGGP